MATTYYVEDSHGDSAFISTAARTATGIIGAAMQALGMDIGIYTYYAPNELISCIADTMQLTQKRAVLQYVVELEGIDIYPCTYIHGTGAYKRSYRPLTLDLESNDVY